MADAPVVEAVRDGTMVLKYTPKEEGIHEVILKYNGEQLKGSPLRFHVDGTDSGYLTAHGSGLAAGISGELANFTISAKNVKKGQVAVRIEGPSKTTATVHENKDETVSVSYLPTSPGLYQAHVTYSGRPIRGSPFNIKVTGEGRKRNQISISAQSETPLPGKISVKDVKVLNALITAPSGLEEPCFLKKLANDHLGITFTPREVGQHIVNVRSKGSDITGSPFKIVVNPKEVGDSNKVKVSGEGLKEGTTQKNNKVSVDLKEAGHGGLSFSIEGPSKAELKCEEKSDGKSDIIYSPDEPGFYIINLKFADHHVKGSPFTVKVTGSGSNTQVERIKRERASVEPVGVGSKCQLTFKLAGVSALELGASVTTPGEVTDDATITEADGFHAVNFKAKEAGVYTVSVRYRDVHIPGSPFPYTVGPIKSGGSHKVHAGGPGLERGEQGQKNSFNIWNREAGAGQLAVSVEGPSKAEISFLDRPDGASFVEYVVSEPGEYRIGIKFNDQHIPDSPYIAYISPTDNDAHRVVVGQLPDGGIVQVDKPIIFSVDRGGCKGQLMCKTVSPSGQQDDCFAQYLDEDTYSVRFLPKENGVHQLHVKWNNVHVPGSPFRLKIGKQDADPAAVHAHGKGLEKGHTGQKSDFLIDTCSAGSGTLAVVIEGPSKVAMDCTEADDGYKVRYTPLIPGTYYIDIKYDGFHIPYSPFKVDVTGDELAEKGAKEKSTVTVETVPKVSSKHQEEKQGPALPQFSSDAKKVTSKGMGLKKAFIGRQNQFSVDAGMAGQDMLWVSCIGPKNPCEEIHVKHMGRNQYQVHYNVKERGKYMMVVRWGSKDIPGSPFQIEV